MTIFEFSAYKDYLKAYIRHLPKNGRGEVNKMARQLRVNSTLVSQVLSGIKDFTIEQSQELCDYIGLGALETDYFILLVQQERAGTAKLKKYYLEKLEVLRKESLQVAKRIQQDRKMTDLERSIFYSSWLYTAIRLYTSVENGKSLEQIIDRFDIPRPRAVEILRFLVETGLCSEEGGIYKIGAQRTHVEKGSPFLLKHHSNWRIKAIEHSEGLSDEELLFTAPFSVSKKDFARFREQLMSVIKSISDQVKDSPAEDVACLNIDMFWMK